MKLDNLPVFGTASIVRCMDFRVCTLASSEKRGQIRFPLVHVWFARFDVCGLYIRIEIATITSFSRFAIFLESAEK